LEQRRYWLASQKRSRWRCWLGPEVRGDYIKTQKSPGLKKHFYCYVTSTMTMDQTRSPDPQPRPLNLPDARRYPL